MILDGGGEQELELSLFLCHSDQGVKVNVMFL